MFIISIHYGVYMHYPIVFNRALYKEWLNTYESLTDMVVPRSSRLLQEDHDFGLYTVSVFKKVVDEYKLHAREKR